MTTGLTEGDGAVLTWLYYHPGVDERSIRPNSPPMVRSVKDASEGGLARAMATHGFDIDGAIQHLESTGHLSRSRDQIHLTARGRATAYSRLESQAIDASVTWLKAMVARLGPGIVVDLGGGSGRLLEVAITSDQTGIVLDEDRHSMAANPRRVKFLLGDGHHLPIIAGAVSGMVSRLAFMYMDERRVMHEAWRVLVPGGHLLVINTGPGFLFRSLGQASGSLRRLSATMALAGNTALFSVSGRALKVGGRRDHLQPRRRVHKIAGDAGFRLVETGRSGIAYASPAAYYMLFQKR